MRRLIDRVRANITGFPNVSALERRGLQLGEGVYLGRGVIIDADFAWLVSIGDGTTIAPRSILLAHDASIKNAVGYSRAGRVDIGKRCFLGAHVIVLPGVTIGDDSIIGAGTVVHGDVPPGSLVVGSRMNIIGSALKYTESHRQAIDRGPTFDRNGFTVRGGITEANKATMRERLRAQDGYVH